MYSWPRAKRRRSVTPNATPEEQLDASRREWHAAEDALCEEEARVAEAKRQAERRVAEADCQAERRVAQADRQLETAVREAQRQLEAVVRETRRKAAPVRQSAAEAVRRAQQRRDEQRQRAADGAHAFAELGIYSRAGARPRPSLPSVAPTTRPSSRPPHPTSTATTLYGQPRPLVHRPTRGRAVATPFWNS